MLFMLLYVPKKDRNRYHITIVLILHALSFYQIDSGNFLFLCRNIFSQMCKGKAQTIENFLRSREIPDTKLPFNEISRDEKLKISRN
jgi:hypothetical protein